MNVRLDPQQELLRSSAREFLEKECPTELVREMMNDPTGVSRGLWQKLGELGWLGLVLPEEHGGAALSLVELSLLLEEMGRVLVPAPFLSSALVGLAVARGGSEAQKARILPAMARGDLTASLADHAPRSQGRDVRSSRLRATPDGNGGLRIEGAKLFVPDAQVADIFLVPVELAEPGSAPELELELEGSVALILLGAGADGVTVEPTRHIDPTRRVASLRLDDVRVEAGAILADRDAGWPLLAWLRDAARVGLCAELCGGAGRVLDLSLDYARTREQFGRPIGSFQAIQHKCVDMLVRVESARSATWYAAWALAAGAEDAHAAACLAKAYCSEACVAVAAEGIQIHGGLGFTWEQDLQLYYKRAISSAVSFGDASACRELAARELIDAPARA